MYAAIHSEGREWHGPWIDALDRTACTGRQHTLANVSRHCRCGAGSLAASKPRTNPKRPRQTQKPPSLALPRTRTLTSRGSCADLPTRGAVRTRVPMESTGTCSDPGLALASRCTCTWHGRQIGRPGRHAKIYTAIRPRRRLAQLRPQVGCRARRTRPTHFSPCTGMVRSGDHSGRARRPGSQSRDHWTRAGTTRAAALRFKPSARRAYGLGSRGGTQLVGIDGGGRDATRPGPGSLVADRA